MSVPASRWAELLAIALPALDYVFGPEDQAIDDPDWTLGGGTAIALLLDHRISLDIDIFLTRGGLRNFAPHNNPAAKAISSRYQWPGHYLKFERQEGEIDFLSSSLLTRPGVSAFAWNGRTIALETCEEVLVKKVRYRSHLFKARDAFDLAAAARSDPTILNVLGDEASDALPRTMQSLDFITPQDVREAVSPTPAYAELVDTAVERAKLAVRSAVEIAAGRQPRVGKVR